MSTSQSLENALAAALEPLLRRVVEEAVRTALAAQRGAPVAQNELLRLNETARRLATSPTTIRRMVAAGDLPVVRLNNSVRFRAEDVAKLAGGPR
jgi:excisionase family DNA binding protein